MKLSLSKIVVALALFLTTTAYAQEQGLIFNYFGGGARSEGMGQAFLAISNDATAGSWNPAGLYIHEKTLMAFSYGVFMPRGEYTYNLTPSLSENYPHDGSYGAIDYMSIISPMRIKEHHFVFSLSYTRNFDTYFEFADKLRLAPTDDPNAVYSRQGGINSINLSLGTRIYKQLSFGLSGNVYYGNVATEEKRSFKYDTTLSYYGTYTYYMNTQVLDSTSYSGFNLSLGLHYNAGKIKGGLVIKTPFNLKGSSDSSIYQITTLNGVVIKDATDTVYVDNMTSKLEMPFTVGLGGAYNIDENFLIAADLEYRNFSGKVVKSLDSVLLTASGDRVEFYRDNDYNWGDVVQFRIGAEYLLKTNIGEIPIRAGFRNESFPYGNISDYRITYEGPKGSTINDSSRVSYTFEYNTERVTGNSLSLGSGIHWAQIILDFAYTYTTYEQEIYHSDVLQATNKWKNHHLNFTFTGYF
jgi:long-subunit fatty acid transport protein